MHECVAQEQLHQRLQAIESPDGAMHLTGDLPWRDVVLTVVGLVVAIVTLIWWAY